MCLIKNTNNKCTSRFFVMLDKKLEYYSFDSIPISIIIEEITYLISAYVIRDYIFYVCLNLGSTAALRARRTRAFVIYPRGAG